MRVVCTPPNFNKAGENKIVFTHFNVGKDVKDTKLTVYNDDSSWGKFIKKVVSLFSETIDIKLQGDKGTRCYSCSKHELKRFIANELKVSGKGKEWTTEHKKAFVESAISAIANKNEPEAVNVYIDKQIYPENESS